MKKAIVFLTLLYAVVFGTVGDGYEYGDGICGCNYYFIDPVNSKEQYLNDGPDETFYYNSELYSGEAICENYCGDDSIGKMKDGKPHGEWKEFIAKDKADAIAKTVAAVKKGSFIDARDNKTYKTVKIGSQTWFAENLNYDAKDSKCYDNKPANCDNYGRLYNWDTAKKVCPAGWHLPTEAEWEILTAIAGGKIAGKYLKSVKGWKFGNGEDIFGFSALPGGGYYFYSNDYGISSKLGFNNAGYIGFWWSAKDHKGSYMYYKRADVPSDSFDKSSLYSVRCVQD